MFYADIYALIGFE